MLSCMAVTMTTAVVSIECYTVSNSIGRYTHEHEQRLLP